MTAPRVVGLDLSLSSTGIAFPNGHTGTIGRSLAKDATTAARIDRLVDLRDRLTDTCRRRCSCGDTGWVEDEGWQPDDPRSWRGERSEGDGLVPCGFCGDWNLGPEEHVEGIDLTVIEGFSFGSPQGATEAGGLGWIIRLALHEHSIPFAIVAPATLKKFATGKGNAGKDDMKLAAQSRLGVTFTGTGSGDRCDARWLQEMGLHHLGAPTVELPAVNLSALAKVEWPT